MIEPSQCPSRRMRGFEQTSGLLKERIRAAGETRGFAVTRLLTHWAEILGPEIAPLAVPVKVGYGRGGLGATLTLLTTGARAPIVEMQKDKIRDKVNACYGYSAISRVHVTQTAPTGFAEGQVAFQAAPKPTPPPDPVITARARDLAEDVNDPGLRQALESLSKNFWVSVIGD